MCLVKAEFALSTVATVTGIIDKIVAIFGYDLGGQNGELNVSGSDVGSEL